MVSTCRVRPRRCGKVTVLEGAALIPRVNLDGATDQCFIPFMSIYDV